MTKQHFICCLLICLMALPCYAKAPKDYILQTEYLEDQHATDGQSFRVLCYHDARENLQQSFKVWPERAALDTASMIEQFEWLRENGYHVVSLDTILNARSTGQKLPPKAILLTFDDGYASIYTQVYPLLKLFNYPAIIGLVGEWLEPNKEGMVFYGDRWIEQKNFVTWPQVREMVASGLVEVGSHSYGLHKGALSNPQGSLPSAAVTRIYNARNNTYEDDQAFIARIRADLARNSALIAHEVGKKPRVMIWPYGAYNMLGVKAATDEGMPITMTLEAGANTPEQSLSRVRRSMLVYHNKVSDLKYMLNQSDKYDGSEQALSRVVAIDLNDVYDVDPIKQEKNVDALVERIHNLGVNNVYIRAVADLDHDGYADTAYFPNQHLPMRADLFNRVAWQLETRSSIPAETFYAFAWLPIERFELPSGEIASHNIIKELYEDAAKNSPRVGGVLLGDLNDDTLHQNQAFISFSHELISTFRIHQPYALSALLSAVKPDDDLKTLASLTKQYDFIALSLASTAQQNEALTTLTDTMANIPNALNSTVFLLPANTNTALIASQLLSEQLKLLQQNGARNFGYYGDNATQNHPKTSEMRSAISLHTNSGK